MARPTRLVQIQFQQLHPRTVTLTVAVPEGWTDEVIKGRLTDIYEEVDGTSHDWCDQDDYDPQEGTHELLGEPDPKARPDLIFPVDDDDDEEEEDDEADGG
jgi:hypothetical protein